MHQPKADLRREKYRNRFHKALYGHFEHENQNLDENNNAGMANDSTYIFHSNNNYLKKSQTYNYNKPNIFHNKNQRNSAPIQIIKSPKQTNHQSTNRIRYTNVKAPKIDYDKMLKQNYKTNPNLRPAPDNYKRNKPYVKSFDNLLDHVDWLSMGLLDRNIDGYNECLSGYYGYPNTYLPKKVNLIMTGDWSQWERSI